MQISELGMWKSYLSCKKRYNIKLGNGDRPLGGQTEPPRTKLPWGPPGNYIPLIFRIAGGEGGGGAIMLEYE